MTSSELLSGMWIMEKKSPLVTPRSEGVGTMFIKSIDASAYVKDAQLLCELLDNFIQEIGPQYVVQVITDNAANYVVAGKLLMERYQTLYWTPCAAHCIDLMLEDMGKIPWIKEIVESARSVTKYIYIIIHMFLHS
jgi:hypothetical protein